MWLSVETIDNGLIKIKAAAIGAPSLNFADDNSVLEILCKPYRDFYTWRPDDDDYDYDDGVDIDPLTPNNLEPME